MNFPDWQPIETAPKDGTEILVFDKIMEKPMLVAWEVGDRFHKRRKEWCVPGSEQDEQGGSCTADLATHWMPVPPNP